MALRSTDFTSNIANGVMTGRPEREMESIKPNSENSITLKPMPESSSDSETASRVLSWIIDQLTTLAEAFGEGLTEERMEIYARALADVPQDRLNVAFQRALRERTFFPKVAELRALALASSDEGKKVEANAAWDYVNQYLRKWGVDLLPLYSNGNVMTPPRLDARTDYALRRVGGLRALNQVDVDKVPFMYRDFCEAYALAPVADLLAQPLQQQFGEDKLEGSVKQLTEAKSMNREGEELNSNSKIQPLPRGNEGLVERRARLKWQADQLSAKSKSR